MKKTLKSIPFSVTLKYTQLAQEMQSKGMDVIRLTAGEPDFDTPHEVSLSAKLAIDEGFTKYTPASGIPELRKGISELLKTKYHLDYAPSQIIVTNGGKQALFQSLYAITNPSDEIIVLTPDWVSYVPQIEMCGCQAVLVETDADNDFQPNILQIAEKVTERTRGIIINSPNNPTGTVYTGQTLEKIAELALEKDLWVISDEIYANLVYDGTHVSIGSLGKIIEKTITINGFSKSHAMTGWRCGYVAAPEAIAKEIGKMQSHLSSNINSITQKAALKALLVDTEYMKEAFEKRRAIVSEALDNIGIDYCHPAGAFYFFMDFNWVKDAYQSDDDLTMDLIQNYSLAMVPGSAFHKPWYMRLSYASSEEELKKAMSILQDFKNRH
ncbi:MAG TPA: pyridoxal phosphate-dependent aminotransferase [Thermotogota bacterium]|nr:pyridoxal phosphate-dependent aminotransferase [Thermotogota bacterium]HRW34176.1 pyridoxal phosphate-dependent aminotransferase [Thermotogota bacterium]